MKNRLYMVLAITLLLLGSVSMLTPIPGGTLLLAAGLTLLISVSPMAQYCIRWLRARYGPFNKAVLYVETKIGGRFESIGKTLKLTDPGDLEANQTHGDYVRSQIAKSKKAGGKTGEKTGKDDV